MVIHDTPRFRWRGLMIDCGRHFIPVDVLKRTLDGMASVKLNVFHWHLSEDQGFRMESKTFPKLTELGSDGLFYTQEQAREIVAYARDRGIRVVPEFDMPGHTSAWFVGYPDLASAAGPFHIERKFGVFDPVMDPTRESTYKFLDTFIGEMAPFSPTISFTSAATRTTASSGRRIRAFRVLCANTISKTRPRCKTISTSDCSNFWRSTAST